MAEQMVEAYDTNTGAKLTQRVPEGWLRIFSHLSKTPKSEKQTDPTNPTPPETPSLVEPSPDWTVTELREYADAQSIPLASSLTKPQILTALAEHGTSTIDAGDAGATTADPGQKES